MERGFDEGGICGRDGCQGIIALHPVEGCSCHINPPCSACTAPRAYCPECGWEEADDPVETPAPSEKPAQATYTPWKPRVLDKTKIDYRIEEHSTCSQKCIGVYPEGTSMDDVRKVVNGTFGGRFERFGNGEFVFIAYTD